MTLEALQAHMETWKGAWPKLTRKALRHGATLIQREIKRRWSGVTLQTNTHRLIRAVKTSTKLNPLSAKIYVQNKQQYKAQVHEQGRVVSGQTHKRAWKRGKDGKLHHMGYAKTSTYMQLGPPKAKYYGRPHQVIIPARPTFEPSRKAMMREVLSNMEKTIVEGYKNV
jgi:hypothetical protein